MYTSNNKCARVSDLYVQVQLCALVYCIVRTELAKVKSELTEVHSLCARLGSKAEGKENKYEPSNRGHSNRDCIVTNVPRSQPRHYPPMDGHNFAVSSTSA